MEGADTREGLAYDELNAYTLQRGDVGFSHQHVVDAHAAQSASLDDPPIRLAQALVGLYLNVEHGVDGRRIQRVHSLLAGQRPDRPRFVLPEERGRITPIEVIAHDPGRDRDAAIEAWAADVWIAYRPQRDTVEDFLERHGIGTPG
jgi:Family of unknown function (DUF5946)